LAWHWKHTDIWHNTLPGTKNRIPLFDEQGQRIRGKENRSAAEQAFDCAEVAEASQQAGVRVADQA